MVNKDVYTAKFLDGGTTSCWPSHGRSTHRLFIMTTW